MQREAWISAGSAAILGSFGMFGRWLQVLNVFEEDTGLARPGAFLSWLVALLCMAAAVILLLQVWRLRRYTAPTEPAIALFERRGVFRLLMAVSGLLTAVGSVLLFARGDLLTQILAILGLCAAAGLFFYPYAPKLGDLGCLIAVAPVLFFCFWLIVSYKENAADPVIWDYAIEILAIASSSLAFYYLAGYLFYRAKPMRTAYFVLLAAYFCLTTLSDSRGLGATLLFVAAALAFLILGWVLVYNLRMKE